MGMELLAKEVCATQDFVHALLDFLVDPLLPASRCLSKEPPLQEDLVAKQMHAVVLLYNYYHRRQNPGLEFLEYDSFCKMAMGLKPNLLSYLSLTQRSDYGELELNDLDKHMSVAEKKVVNGCDVSRSLDALNDKPDIEGWPISKVAVFLVDLKKENCLLFHSSITQGVWSVIEKDVTLPGEEAANKKKRVIKKTPKENQTADDAVLQKVAYSSVKEACAFNQGDLRILEAHTVYSTSKEKTSVRLYIMQCRNSKQEEYLVPISDALGSLQGPLVKKESGSWLLTPVVEYFHLLPFAEKLSDWHSRSKAIHANGTHVEAEEWPNPSPTVEEINELDDCNGSHFIDKLVMNTSGSLGVAKNTINSNNHRSVQEVIPNLPQHCEAAQAVKNGSKFQSKEKALPSAFPLVEPAKVVQNGSASNLKKELFSRASNHSEMTKAVENNHSSQQKDVPIEPTKVYKRNRYQKNISSNFQGSNQSNAAKEYLRQEKECPVNGSPNSASVHEPCRYCADDQKQIVVVQEPDQSAFNGGAIVVAENNDTNSHMHDDDDDYFDQEEKQGCDIVSHESNSEYLQKLLLTIAPKEDLISQTALKVLLRKRELLAQKIRDMSDEVALCDRNIEIIVKGGEDDLAVKLNSLMEGCNDLYLTSTATENKTGLHFEDPDLPRPMKRKRLSDANLSSLNPCRELDHTCNENTWTLPTYNVSTLEGGFKASVTMKGVDFECSSDGTLSPTPQDARNSAALLMLDKLQNMQRNCSSLQAISPGSGHVTN